MVSDTFEIPLMQSGLRSAVGTPRAPRARAYRQKDAFVGGDENRLIPTALDDLLENPESEFNPLVLCGPSGIGKSLLARCLSSQWQQRQPTTPQQKSDPPESYYTGDDWYRAYLAAVRDDNLQRWRKKCRQVTILVIDDIPQLSRKFAAQRELVLLMDDLVAANVPVIATVTVEPAECEGIDPGLASRLSGGLVIHVQPPGAPARQRIVAQLAAAHPRQITTEALEWFAEQFSGNVPALQHTLLGCLSRADQRLRTNQSNTRSKPDTDIDRHELRRLHTEWVQQQSVSIKAITKSVSRYCQVPVKNMVGASRRHTIVQARSLAMYLAKKLSGQSLRTIGQHFGGRDHTTVLHACQKIESNQSSDAALRLAVDELTQILRSRHREMGEAQ